MIEESDDSQFRSVNTLVSDLMKIRQRNLLILYYASTRKPTGYIIRDDVERLLKLFRTSQSSSNGDMDLDVIVHCLGGDPSSAYRIAQLIRFFSSNVNILIPEFAYSAATLLSFCGDNIYLSIDSCISPIDVSSTVGENGGESVEVINIDYYIRFVEECRKKLEDILDGRERKYHKDVPITKIEEPLLVALVKEVGTLRIGKFFRERLLTAQYAEALLEDYLLKRVDRVDKLDLSKKITKQLIFECPSHQFDIDYNLARKMKIPIKLMNMGEAEMAKNLLYELRKLEIGEKICKCIRSDYRIPFFRLYKYEDINR